MKTPYKLLLAGLVLAGIAASGPIITRLRDLYDVKFGPLSNGQVLTYNSTAARWTNSPAGAGSGDMTQAAYDADANGVVDIGAGGTGSNLSDPGADRLLGWDDSKGSNDWFTVGTGLAITGDTLSATGGGEGSGGFTNMMVSTITFATTLAPTLDIAGLSTTAAAPRRVTFRCTLTDNVTTVSAPAGTLIDGDSMVWEMIQDGTGSRTITGWDTGAGGYAFGTDITGITLSTTASKRDFISWTYNATAGKWYCVGFTRGY